MVGELPANVSFGTVIGRFVLAVQDSADGGTDPDGNAAVGTVTFTPSITHLLDAAATPPTTIIPRAIVCTLDTDGILNDPQGSDFVKLIATDDADLEPSGWTWDVAIAITGETTRTFSIAVSAGGTVDLTTVAAVASSTGNSTLGHSERENEVDQSVATGVPENVLWPTSIVAERGGLAHNSLTGVWTVGVAGTYLVTAYIPGMGGLAGGDGALSILRDATPVTSKILDPLGEAALTATFDADAGAEITVQLAQGSGGDVEIAGGGYATVHRLV